jgi:hypothetical protein
MHTIYIYNDSVHFNNNSYAMQSSVPTLSCLTDSNLNMCLQKWFQRKMWNYDKINNSRSWIVCISITLIKWETVNLFLCSLNTLPNKKCIAVWQVKTWYIQVLINYVIFCSNSTNSYISSYTTMHMQAWQMVFVLINAFFIG